MVVHRFVRKVKALKHSLGTRLSGDYHNENKNLITTRPENLTTAHVCIYVSIELQLLLQNAVVNRSNWNAFNFNDLLHRTTKTACG